MNGKQSKKLRRMVGKRLRNEWTELFNAACAQKLRNRIKLAWRLVRGRKY